MKKTCLLAAVLFAILPALSASAQHQSLSAALPTINGLKPLILRRARTSRHGQPQFLSITLLPGRAMNVFQITADIPGHGEISLLQSPSLDEAAQRLNDAVEDPWGYRSYSMGGAFLIPWSSRISGQVSPDGQTITTAWHGQPLALRINSGGKYAVHGLVNKLPVVDIRTIRTRDGARVTGIVHAGNFGGRWLSSTDLQFSISLNADAIDLAITAKNVGHAPEPMAIGWHPYFLIPSHNRAQARLHLTAERFADVFASDGKTTGSFTPVTGTALDFRDPHGNLLPNSMNVNFSNLDRDAGCTASLIDRRTDYGLCVQPTSSAIHTIQVYSPKDSSFVAIEPQLNFPDPLGDEWKGMDTGLATLQPGASVVWQVRLELFRPSLGP